MFLVNPTVPIQGDKNKPCQVGSNACDVFPSMPFLPRWFQTARIPLQSLTLLHLLANSLPLYVPIHYSRIVLDILQILFFNEWGKWNFNICFGVVWASMLPFQGISYSTGLHFANVISWILQMTKSSIRPFLTFSSDSRWMTWTSDPFSQITVH